MLTVPDSTYRKMAQRAASTSQQSADAYRNQIFAAGIRQEDFGRAHSDVNNEHQDEQDSDDERVSSDDGDRDNGNDEVSSADADHDSVSDDHPNAGSDADADFSDSSQHVSSSDESSEDEQWPTYVMMPGQHIHVSTGTQFIATNDPRAAHRMPLHADQVMDFHHPGTYPNGLAEHDPRRHQVSYYNSEAQGQPEDANPCLICRREAALSSRRPPTCTHSRLGGARI
ncbi:hypothetical protein AMS68_007856 [Peltaster fructicola]|uniref:Uncharacterized protein n=1 Tax=Peltaster fructicola TaxID=286661 RepID=A0A6H0Y675_9PEZI|nr:hypothetical protein AMS68_007856 [Peltaster fructicola]